MIRVLIPYNEDLTRVDLSGASEFHTAYSLMNEEVEVALSGASDFYGDLNALSVRLDMSGASGFFGDINGDGIDVSLSGASNIEGKLTGIVLDLELSGASDAALMGQIAILKIDLSGASDIIEKVVGNKYGLVCDQCEGKVSGGSAAYIHCDSSIEVSLSGGSELHYTGNASTTDSNTSGESGIIHDVLP